MKQLVAALAVGALVGLVVSSVSCGPKPPCSSDNCTGCCTGSGMCEDGISTAHCGSPGALCHVCSGAQLCIAGQCTTDAGMGGGSGGGSATGGGSAGGTQATGGGTQATGGGSGGCSEIPDAGSGGTDQGSYAPDPNQPGFAQETALVTLPTSTPGTTDVLAVLLYRQTNGFPPVPYLATIQPLNYAQCHDCVIFSTGCDAMGSHCTEDYLAQAGVLSVSASTTKVDAGTFVGAVTDVRFVQWDFDNDAVIDGGKCINLHHGAFNAAWP
jgi:hypothetical protein